MSLNWHSLCTEMLVCFLSNAGHCAGWTCVFACVVEEVQSLLTARVSFSHLCELPAVVAGSATPLL